jgi:hypothetical protein
VNSSYPYYPKIRPSPDSCVAGRLGGCSTPSALAEFRQYRDIFDSSLQTGPYNFGFLNNPQLGNYAERYPYQDGLLVSYWDTSQGDNDTSLHPGEGLILPIDSHPEPLLRPDNNLPWSARRQSYDSPFGLDTTDVITLHANSIPGVYGGLPAVSTFDDSLQYWRAATPSAGVRNPHTGTVIEIRSMSAHDSFMEVQVRPVRSSVFAARLAIRHRQDRRTTASVHRQKSIASDLCGALPPGRCPFVALSVHQRAANGGKRRHKAKAEDRPILRVMMRDPATSSTRRQRAANVSFSAC